MKPLSLYQLQPIVDDPRYEGFGTDQRSFLGNTTFAQDFLPDDNGRMPRLGEVWRPVKVVGRVRSFNDYPCVSLLIPTFSERAVEVLRDVLESNGELLPLSSSLGRYYAYNLTTIVDVLDAKRSDVSYYPESCRAMYIDRYEVRPGKLEGLTIFQLRQEQGQVYVTDPFVLRVKEHGLKGFDFIKVWPLPKGADWRALHKRQKRRRERSELPTGCRIKGESVFIRLELGGTRLSKKERKLLDRAMCDLDQLLVDPASEAPTIGSLEGHECSKGVCEMRLSCPDAAALARKLMPWLNTLVWPRPIVIVKRNMPFDNLKARETPVTVRRSAGG